MKVTTNDIIRLFDDDVWREIVEISDDSITLLDGTLQFTASISDVERVATEEEVSDLMIDRMLLDD